MSPLLILMACHASHETVHPPVDFSTCLTGWTRTSGESIAEDQRQGGARPWPTPPTYILSSTIPPDFVAARHTAEWLMGRPVFWFDANRSELFVDEQAFDTLTPVDTTKLPSGMTVFVGQVLPSTRVALTDRDVVGLLVEADVIRIYGENGGRVCLIREQTEGGSWHGHFIGEHDGTGGRLDFRIGIDGGGHITATGV